MPPARLVRQAVRPSSLVATLLVGLLAAVALRGELAARPVMRLDVDTGGPATGSGGAVGAENRPPTLSEYHVRPGDTLSEVARLHGVGIASMLRVNALRPPYALRAGDVLRVPDVDRPASGVVPSSRHEVADVLRGWAERYDVRADVLSALAWRESSWRQEAVSEDGAVGVAQVLPTTARWVSERLIGEPLDPRRVDDNARLAARYLRWLLDRYHGDVGAALAAYHQGPRSLESQGWYESSERYVADVLRLRHEFA